MLTPKSFIHTVFAPFWSSNLAWVLKLFAPWSCSLNLQHFATKISYLHHVTSFNFMSIYFTRFASCPSLLASLRLALRFVSFLFLSFLVFLLSFTSFCFISCGIVSFVSFPFFGFVSVRFYSFRFTSFHFVSIHFLWFRSFPFISRHVLSSHFRQFHVTFISCNCLSCHFMFMSFQFISFHSFKQQCSDEFNETPVALKTLSCRVWISFSHRIFSKLPLQRSQVTQRSRVLLAMCVCWCLFIASAIKISVKKWNKTASFMEESTPTTSPVQVETGVRAPLWGIFGSMMFELAKAWRKGATFCGILQHFHSERLLKVSFGKLQQRSTRRPRAHLWQGTPKHQHPSVRQ